MNKLIGFLSLLLLVPVGCNRAPETAAAPETEPAQVEGGDGGLIATRAGAPRVRTPEEDPRISLNGPHVGALTRLAGAEGRLGIFAPGGKAVLFSTYEAGKPSKVWAVDVTHPENRRVVAEVEKCVFGIQCADAEGRKVFIEEKLADTEEGATSGDSRFWWIDVDAKKEVTGAWEVKNIDCQKQALSPDGRFVVLTENHSKPDASGGYTVLRIVDLQTDKKVGGDIDKNWLELSHWVGAGNDLRLLMLTGLDVDLPARREPYVLDPTTGACDPGRREDFAELTPHVLTSPDGKTVATIVDRRLLEFHTQGSAEVRTVDFHPEDWRYVTRDYLAWADNRYLVLQSPFTLVIDSRTLRMNYPLGPGAAGHGTAGPGAVTFSPDFKCALVKTGEGLFLGPVVGGE